MIEEHNILPRARLLEQRASNLLLPSLQREYEHLDRFRIKTVTKAEQYCWKLRMGQVAFSPALAHARLHIQAWLLIKK
jgi:hypothetical protein